MFDDREPGVGEERDRFLTDESGRRVYFPLVGTARVVPSGDQEAKLKTARLFVFITGMAFIVVAAFVKAFLPERSAPFAEGWIMLLMFGAHELIAFRLVRHWAAIPSTDLSYARYVVARHMKRSLTGLCFAILGRVIVLIGMTAALAWLATHSPPPGWDDWTSFKKVSWLVLLIFLMIVAIYVAISGYRAVTALRNKYWGP
jgi:hypothetical protein